MRIEPAGRPHKWNTFQQRLGRLRPDFNVISWHATRNDPLANIPTANVLAKLKPWHHEMNTTRGLTPGLLIPELGEDGGRIPLPDYEDGRGFGREFARRQGPSAGPASQPSRKRTRKPRPQAQAAVASSSSQDNDSAEESFSDDEEEQPPQRKARRVSRASQNPTLPSSHPGVSVSRDSARRGRQNIQQAPSTNTQQSIHPLFEHPVHPLVQHPVQQSVHPLFQHPVQQGHSVDTQQSVHPLFQHPVRQARSARTQQSAPQLAQPPVQEAHSVDTQQSAPQLAQPPVQQPMGNTPNTFHNAPSLSQQTAYVNAPGSSLVPYPPGFVGTAGPIRPMTNTQLLGRSSTDARNVIRFSGIGHSDRRPPYHPFTRMDLRNTQRARPPLAPHFSAGTQAAAPSADDTQEEPRFRHFRVPGPSPTLTPSEEELARTRNDKKNGYVDPFHVRFYRKYLPSVSVGRLNPVLETRLTFEQRLQTVTGHELLSTEAAAEALQIETVTKPLRTSDPVSQRRERQAGRERNLSNDMPPALDIARRMAGAQVQSRGAHTFRARRAHDLPNTPTPFNYNATQGSDGTTHSIADKSY